MTQFTFPFDDDDDENKKREPYSQPPTTRNSDPETSYEAVHDAEFHASEGRILVMCCLFEYGPCTDYELEAFTGRQQNSIGKRRLECQRAGLVEVLIIDGVKQKRLAPSGSKCLVWKLTTEGHDYAITLLLPTKAAVELKKWNEVAEHE
jgi:hypothetical protein